MTDWGQVRLFGVLLVLISAGGYTLLALLGETNIFLLAAPALAALITKLVMQRNLRGLQGGPPPWRWIPISYSIPLVISGLPFVAYWIVTGGFSGDEQPPLAQFAMAAGPVFLTAAVFALGEEIGWRGFLVPELAKTYSFSTVALATGVLWAIWHWPLILLSTDVTGLNLVSPVFAIPAMTIILTGAGTLLAWMTLQSKSLWPAVVMHGAQNAFTHGFFLEATAQTGRSPYFVSEAGGLLAVTWAIAAIYVLSRARTAA